MKKQVLSIRIDDDVRQHLAAVAAANRVTVGRVAREALRSALGVPAPPPRNLDAPWLNRNGQGGADHG